MKLAEERINLIIDYFLLGKSFKQIANLLNANPVTNPFTMSKEISTYLFFNERYVAKCCCSKGLISQDFFDEWEKEFIKNRNDARYKNFGGEK